MTRVNKTPSTWHSINSLVKLYIYATHAEFSTGETTVARAHTCTLMRCSMSSSVSSNGSTFDRRSSRIVSTRWMSGGGREGRREGREGGREGGR